MKNFFSRALFLVLFLISTMFSIAFYVQLKEAEECIDNLIKENNKLKTHIKYLEKEITFREDEISFLGFKCDSLIYELNKFENIKN